MKAAATAVIGLVAGATSAQFTAVQAPPGSERGHAEILSRALGETFTAAGDRDLASGSWNAIRLADTDDQTWTAGTYTATIIGKQAGYRHSFGTLQDGTYDALLNSRQIGASATVSIEGDFAWAIKNKSGARDTWSSTVAHNRDGVDHMVTYALSNGEGFQAFAVFFEDLPIKHSDNDFNDVGVLLSIVPTPQAAGLAFAGLGGLGIAAGRRRR